MAVDPDDLRTELKHLRRDEGRTLVKLLASNAVRQALGDPPDGELLARFDAAVRGIGADLKSLALKNAYAIGVSAPGTLTYRRETFGGQAEVDRGPETIFGWENEAIEELIARLQTPPRGDQHLLVAVAVENGMIHSVVEGAALPGGRDREVRNPLTEPFLPAFIYQLPLYASPTLLTIAGVFLDDTPTTVYAQACGDLLPFVCGDGRQRLKIQSGGIPGIDAAAHVVVHYRRPIASIYYGLAWTVDAHAARKG